jgi:apolipoprotein N-acyltransferase
VLVFVLPQELWRLAGLRQDGRWRGVAIAAAVGPLVAMTLYGVSRLNRPHASGEETAARIRIVQPAIRQTEKWRPEHQRRIFDEHLALSLTAPGGAIDNAADISMILWPEAAMPFLPLDQPIALSDIGRMLPAHATLVAGALRAEPATAERPRYVYNSLLSFGAGEQARPLQAYDKAHLVPFGEYLPLQRVLEAVGLQQLSRLRGGFAAGPEPRSVMTVPGVGAMVPLICYEVLFPGRVVQTAERPLALLNVTNDGWFGDTTGPRQHFHMARVRAVEEGLPLLRAANNGISAVVDAYGRVEHALWLNMRGTIDARVPARLPAPVYAALGDLLFFGILFAIVCVIAVRNRMRFH